VNTEGSDVSPRPNWLIWSVLKDLFKNIEFDAENA